jgi:phosphate transport system protein
MGGKIMTRHLALEIDKLKQSILHLSDAVIESLQKSVEALQKKDIKLAQEVISNDAVIDRMEVDSEEECLKVLALHQPVAGDLRFIVAILKINSDLERIGDFSVHISDKAIQLSKQDSVKLPPEFYEMARKTEIMLKKSVEALVNLDADVAGSISMMDDEIDDMNRKISDDAKTEIRKHPELLDPYSNILSVSRSIERMADHVTNIAEDIIYMVEGEIVRHKAHQVRRQLG